jgi:tetratricopeptide (TPR) repeat protein
LCYLPLAIVQAGAFISQSGALNSYLDIYTKNRAQLLSEKPAQSHDDYVWTVYTTWQMSFDQLSQPAAMFLQLCSFLHRDGISEDIFSRAAAYEFRQVIPSREALQKPLEFLAQFLEPTGAWDTLRFLKVANEIKAYSLMSFDPERKMFSIHPLVHDWSRTTISDQQCYHSIMALIMGMSIRQIPTVHHELTSLRLISHIEFLRHGNEQVVVDFGAEYGIVYYYTRRYEAAKEVLLAVIEGRKQVLGDDHPHTLHALGNLASIYCKLREFHKAKELEFVVLEKRKQVLGDDHPDTLHALNNLASTYNNLREFHKAEELEVVVVEKKRQVLGDEHPDTLQAMSDLASTYHQLGEFHKAEELGVVVLEKQKQVLGDDHPDTLWTMGNLASTYNNLREFHKAEGLEVVVLEKQKQVLGDDHPDTLHALNNLASTYNNLREFHKAEKLEVVVVEKQKQFLGDDHPDALRTMGNLAWTYHNLGKFHKAEELGVVVLEKQKQVLGDDHPDTLRTMGNLASTYHHLGEFHKADELGVVLEKQKQVLGDDHPESLWVMQNLALTYRCLWTSCLRLKSLRHLFITMRKHCTAVSEDSESSDQHTSEGSHKS